MNELKTVSINKADITVKEYQGKRVVTLKDIDLCHGRPDGTAGRNFRTNKQHLIEGTDYFSVELTADEIRRQFGAGKNAGRTITLITESGYLMLVKSFTDDLAWEVQRQLVNTYFNCKAKQPEPDKPYEYFKKLYNGEPVLTLEDAEHLTGLSSYLLNNYLKKNGVITWDYHVLIKDELKKFKSDNPKVSKLTSKITLITKDGFTVICNAYKLNIAQPECFVPVQKSKPLTESIKDIKDRLAAMNVLLDRLSELDSGNETAENLKRRYGASFYSTLTYLSAETDVTISKLDKYFGIKAR